MSSSFVCLKDFEEYAKDVLPQTAKGYYFSGANYEETLRRNSSAFSDIKLYPRFLTKSVENRSMEMRLLGTHVRMPIGAAPTAMHKLAHPEGELATAKACQKMGAVMILSTLSTSSIEEVAAAAPNAVKWFQLYIYRDRSVTLNLIRRAEASGFKAIVLTVDAPIFGIRYADKRNHFHLPPHLRLANFTAGDEKSDYVKGVANNKSAINEYVASYLDPSLTWEDVKWLKSVTKLKVVIKGVLTPEDAVLAIEHGASAVIVSNHGARQLDSVPTSIEVLPEIVRAVASRCEVYLDGGVRSGTDVLKALAYGAKAVFVGRPILWGLCCGGKEGVEHVFTILKTEFDVAMALSTCANLEDITTSLVKPQISAKL